MKTQMFFAFIAALALPTFAFGQCQTNMGDCGVAGQFISEGIVTVGDCGGGNCSPICGGPYISIFGGLQQLQDQNSVGFDRQLELGFDDGFCIGAAIGKRLNRIFRAEIEYAYRESSADTAIFNGNPMNFVGGKTHSNSGVLNGYCDLPVGRGNMVPYVGGGIGVTGVDSDVQYGNAGSTLNGSDSSLAYQWMVGLTWRVFPNAELFAEYRYFEANDPKLNQFGGPPIQGNIPNIILDSEYVSKDVFLGIRMNF